MRNIAREIKTTLALDGEAQFKRSLSSIDSELRVMASELGKVTSKYTENAGSAENLTRQQEILSDQAAAQQEKVRALGSAVADSAKRYDEAAANAEKMAKEYGVNSEEALKAANAMEKAEKSVDGWKIKLNNAEKALAKTNAEIRELEQSSGSAKGAADAMENLKENSSGIAEKLEPARSKMDTIKDASASVEKGFSRVKEEVSGLAENMKSVTDAIGKAAKAAAKITFKAAEESAKIVGSTIEATTKAFAGYTAAVAGSAIAIGALSASAASTADDINTLSTQTGLSTGELQKLKYASDLIDVDTETVTKSMAKMTKNMSTAAKGTGDAAVAFQSLGVSIKDDVTGELRNNQDVFSEAIGALGNIENETQRDAYAMAIFGKSAQDLNPLIEGGADRLKELGDQAESAGLIMGEDALGNLNAFNDSIDTMKANVESTKNIVGGAFAGQFKALTDEVGKAVPEIGNAFAALFDGEQIKKGQASLQNELVSLGKSLTVTIKKELPNFIAGINATILAIVGAIVMLLPDLVGDILPVLLSGFTELMTGLAEFMPTLLPVIVNGAVMLLLGIVDGLNQVVDVLIPMLPGIIRDVGSILVDNLPVLLDGALTLFMGMVEGLGLMIGKLMPMLPELITNITTTLVEHLPEIITGGFQLLIGLIVGITNCIPQLITAIVDLIPVITQALTDNLPALITAGIDLILALALGFPQAIPAVVGAIPDICMAIVNAFREQDWLQIGKDIIKGVASGLVEGVKAIGSTIAEAAGGVVNGFKGALGIHSPSTVMRDQVGKNMADGVGVGFADEMQAVTKSMENEIPTQFNAEITTSMIRKLDAEIDTKKSGLQSTANSSAWGGKQGAGARNYEVNVYIDKVENEKDYEKIGTYLYQELKKADSAIGV